MIRTVRHTGRPPGQLARRGGDRHRPAPGHGFATRPDRVGHRAPGLRPQAAHRSCATSSTRCASSGGSAASRAAPRATHDVFDGGHAGTGVSHRHRPRGGARPPAGSPTRVARQRMAVCVGDAAMQSGLTLEALNHLGHMRHRLLIVLNDNEMSISRSVGGLSTAPQQAAADPGLPGDEVGDAAHAAARPAGRQAGARAAILGEGGLQAHLGQGRLLRGHGDHLHRRARRPRPPRSWSAPSSRRSRCPARCSSTSRPSRGSGYAPAEQDSVSFHGASLPPIDLGLIDPTEEPLPTEAGNGASRRPTPRPSSRSSSASGARRADLRHHRGHADRHGADRFGSASRTDSSTSVSPSSTA